jgi:hypothetical protein
MDANPTTFGKLPEPRTEIPIVRASSLRMKITSVLILAVLALQAIVSIGLFPFGRFKYMRVTWPFLDYPMYSSPHYPGDEIAQKEVLGILADRQEHAIRSDDLGIGRWHFYLLIRAIEREDIPLVRQFIALHQARTGLECIGVKVQNRVLIFDGERALPGPEIRSKTLFLSERLEATP